MNNDLKRGQRRDQMGQQQQQQRGSDVKRPEDLESQGRQKGAQQVPTSQRHVNK